PRPSAKHTLDRINNDHGYTPRNCRWATWEEQAGNRRNSVMVSVGRISTCASAAARAVGLPQDVLRRRIKAGMSAELAISAPVGMTGKRRGKSRKSVA